MLGRRRSEGPVPIRGDLLRPERFEERAKTLAAVSTLLLAMFNTPQLEAVAQDVEHTIVKIMQEAVAG